MLFSPEMQPLSELQHQSLGKKLQPQTFPNSTSLLLTLLGEHFIWLSQERQRTSLSEVELNIFPVKIFPSYVYFFSIFRVKANLDSFLSPLNIKKGIKSYSIYF